MASYPALVQLFRILGRADTLLTLGLQTEPDPARLTDEQRDQLNGLVEMQIENVAAELVAEAAASDDVHDRAAALAFTSDRIAGFSDLLSQGVSARIVEIIAGLVADWG